MKLKERREFEDIISDFTKRNLEYSYEERQRIKERSHQIVALLLVVTSITLATITGNLSNPFFKNYMIIGILLTGLSILTFTMSVSFHLMTSKEENVLIDPKEVYEIYKNEPIKKTKRVLRNELFSIIKDMEKRNDELKIKLWKIYELTIISLIIIFIPLFLFIITTWVM